jgi:CheY-like chemotaxis protein
MRTQTVLVVEDEPDARQMMVDVLRAEGYAVEEAVDGEQALAAVQRWDTGQAPPGVMLLDLMLPRMDGLEVLSRLPGLGCKVPVVATSASGLHLRVAAAAGAHELLPKPFDLEALLAIVGRHCLPGVAAPARRRPAQRLPVLRHLRRSVKGGYAPGRPRAPRCRLDPRRRVGFALLRLQATGQAIDVELALLRARLPGLGPRFRQE